jgi:hypothetical protein
MKNRKENIDTLINRFINETLSERADDLVRDLNELGGMEDNHPKFGDLNLMKMTDDEINAMMSDYVSSYDDEEENDSRSMRGRFFDKEDEESEWDEEEFTEGFDSGEIFRGRRGVDYSQREFKQIPKDADLMSGLDMDSRQIPPSILKRMNLKRKPKKDFDDDFDEFEIVNEGKGETCEQCGVKGSINESGICEQCGTSIKEEYDYISEEELEMGREVSDLEKLGDYCNEDSELYDKNRCEYNRKAIGMEMTEKLHGRQRILDKNRNNKIDSEDFKILRKNKNKNNVKLSESEVIDLIEKIVKEEKNNLRKGTKHKGLTTYEKSHRGSGKENSDYLKSVTKKMKEYLKDGSKGEYSMEPKHFPKGNGELSKMSKKTYIPSDDVQDYTDNLTAAGLENITYDEINPNEEWVNDLMVGSSKTGNNPEWANSVDTGVNKKRRKVQKDNLLGQIKRKAYNKAPQPIVTDKTGEDEGTKILTKLESVEPKESKKLNEEFDRITQLLSYNRKTQ